MRTTTAIIHHDNLIHNLKAIRSFLQTSASPSKLCVSLKANAYGHGLLPVAETCQKAGVDSFFIANVHEGVTLREHNIQLPIYLCSLPLPQEIPDMVAHLITPLITDAQMLELLGKEAQRQNIQLPVHIKVDTGMGRFGCRPIETLALRKQIDDNPFLHYLGIGTHFSSADFDPAFTQQQQQELAQVLQTFDQHHLSHGLVHAANTAAFLQDPHSHYNFVRIGIALYGYSPIADVDIDLRPVMELQSHLVFIKEVPANSPISYGRTYHSKETEYIGTITAGYGDGISRKLSNRLPVLIAGKLYPQVGTICMDHCMVNLGKDKVPRFSPVVFFGPDPQSPSAKDWASWLNTIPYEITCGISWSVPRISIET